MMRDRLMRRCCVLSVAGVVLLAKPAHAVDELGTARGQDLREIEHEVTLRIRDGLATMTVVRSFLHTGKRSEEVQLRLSLPHGAVATDLKIRGKDRWHTAKLLERELAARYYQELTGLGVADPMDPAILYWIWEDLLGLQVFPVLPGKASTVQYTLAVPTEYRDGRYLVTYAESPYAPNLVRPTLYVESSPDFPASVWVNNQPIASGKRFTLGAPSDDNNQSQSVLPGILSNVVIKEQAAACQAWLDLHVQHSYRGDLIVRLHAPSGEIFEVETESDDKSDLTGRHAVAIPKTLDPIGTWQLAIEDRAAMDVGALERWALAFETNCTPATPVVTRPEKSRVQADTKLRAKYRWTSAKDTPLFIPDTGEDNEQSSRPVIAVTTPKFEVIQGRYGVATTREEANFVRLELDVAPRVSTLAAAPKVLFALDASISVAGTTLSLEDQIAMALAYLFHVPDAEADLILAQHHPRRLFGKFVAATHVQTELKGVANALQLKNESPLAQSLAMAADILATLPGTHRAIVWSDNQLEAAFSTEAALQRLPSSAPIGVTHLLVPTGTNRQQFALDRYDAHRLTQIARSTGGVLYLLRGSAEASDPRERREEILQLVRPVRVDNLSTDAFISLPTSLDEGARFREFTRTNDANDKMQVRGELWSLPFEFTLHHSLKNDKYAAGLVFLLGHSNSLSKNAQVQLAMFAHVVSPVTSLLAVEPGVRPQRDGLDKYGRGSGIGFGGGGARVPQVRQGKASAHCPTLEDEVRRAITTCTASTTSPWSLHVALETTHREIVQVHLLGASDPTFAACAVEAIWELQLHGCLGSAELERREVDLSAI